MKVIIGSYRGPEMVDRALRSLEEFATGINAVTIVDDSGNPEWSKAMRGMRYSTTGTTTAGMGYRTSLIPKVVTLKKVGYTRAMQAVCREAGHTPFLFWEEDFVATAPIDTSAMAKILVDRPYLAQVALLRGPHFPIEHEHGGVLEGLIARLGREKAKVVHHRLLGITTGLIEQSGTFTCNPAVWAEGIAEQGWPSGRWTEDAQRDRLLKQGYTFGFLPGVRVAHDGVRSGYGY